MILGILRYAQQHDFFVAEVIFHIWRAGKDGSVGRVRPSQFVSTIYIQPWLDVEHSYCTTTPLTHRNGVHNLSVKSGCSCTANVTSSASTSSSSVLFTWLGNIDVLKQLFSFSILLEPKYH